MTYQSVHGAEAGEGSLGIRSAGIGPDRSAQTRTLIWTFVGFFVLWGLMDRVAAAYGSTRGEGGIQVLAVVLLAALALEYVAFRTQPVQALSSLGFRAPNRKAFVWTAIVAIGLLCFYPLFGVATGSPVGLMAGSWAFAIGIFLQGGLAEEVVFRGFLFRRLREGRSFWRAAGIATIPFVAVHGLLFLVLDPMLATVSLLVAVSLSFPLAWLFERSGGSVWLPAVIHAVVQGSVKLVVVGDEFATGMAVGWMLLSTLVPWVFLLVLRNKRG